jgi:hypothetical protein
MSKAPHCALIRATASGRDNPFLSISSSKIWVTRAATFVDIGKVNHSVRNSVTESVPFYWWPVSPRGLRHRRPTRASRPMAAIACPARSRPSRRSAQEGSRALRVKALQRTGLDRFAIPVVQLARRTEDIGLGCPKSPRESAEAMSRGPLVRLHSQRGESLQQLAVRALPQDLPGNGYCSVLDVSEWVPVQPVQGSKREITHLIEASPLHPERVQSQSYNLWVGTVVEVSREQEFRTARPRPGDDVDQRVERIRNVAAFDSVDDRSNLG